MIMKPVDQRSAKMYRIPLLTLHSQKLGNERKILEQLCNAAAQGMHAYCTGQF
jgi:hypothetical protein